MMCNIRQTKWTTEQNSDIFFYTDATIGSYGLNIYNVFRKKIWKSVIKIKMNCGQTFLESEQNTEVFWDNTTCQCYSDQVSKNLYNF